jgi:hypothetical protein
MKTFEKVKKHWQQLRQGTYQFLDGIKESDLNLKLPFPKSQTIRYQFHCMCGAQESNIPLICEGKWKGYSSSLDKLGQTDIATIKTHLRAADKQMLVAMKQTDFSLTNYMILIEHEAHHQGQLINFIYAHDLPIPKSWQEKWALSN